MNDASYIHIQINNMKQKKNSFTQTTHHYTANPMYKDCQECCTMYKDCTQTKCFCSIGVARLTFVCMQRVVNTF